MILFRLKIHNLSFVFVFSRNVPNNNNLSNVKIFKLYLLTIEDIY